MKVCIRESLTSVLRESLTSVLRESLTSVLRESRTSVLRESLTSVLRESLTSVLRESLTSVLRESRTSVLRESRTSVLRESRTSLLRESLTRVLRESRTSVLKESLTSRPRMEKSHSKRHELLVCWIVSILMVLNVQQARLYLHYWIRWVSLPYQMVNRFKNVPWKNLDCELEVQSVLNPLYCREIAKDVTAKDFTSRCSDLIRKSWLPSLSWAVY